MQPFRPKSRRERILAIRDAVQNRQLTQVDFACLGVCDRVGIAVVASGGDLGTSRHGVPRLVRPFDASGHTLLAERCGLRSRPLVRESNMRGKSMRNRPVDHLAT
jgi:hypothetical protein